MQYANVAFYIAKCCIFHNITAIFITFRQLLTVFHYTVRLSTNRGANITFYLTVTLERSAAISF